MLFSPTAPPADRSGHVPHGQCGADPSWVMRWMADPDRCLALLREVGDEAGDRRRPARRAVHHCLDEAERHAFLDMLSRLAAAGTTDSHRWRWSSTGCGLTLRPQRGLSQLRAGCSGPSPSGPMSDSGATPRRSSTPPDVGLELEPGLVELLLADLGVTTTSGLRARTSSAAGSRAPYHLATTPWPCADRSRLPEHGGNPRRRGDHRRAGVHGLERGNVNASRRYCSCV